MQSIQLNLSQSKIYSEWLKIFAVIFMVIDHIGLVFYPEHQFLRQIGRFAFPLFAYQITIGFQLTSNRKLMFKRLLLFAAISAIPYFLMTDAAVLNIFVTLALGFAAMWILESKKYIWVLPFIFAFPFFVPIDYGIYGVLSILSLYILRKNFLLQVLVFLILTFLYIGSGGNVLQINAVFGLMLAPILLFLKPKFHLHKYFYYAFYPAHMLILWLLDISIK